MLQPYIYKKKKKKKKSNLHTYIPELIYKNQILTECKYAGYCLKGAIKLIIKEGLTPDGLKKALQAMDADIRFNIRNELAEVNFNNKWVACNDRNMAAMRFEIQKRFKIQKQKGQYLIEDPMAFSKQGFYDCRDALLNENEVDDFKLWLETLTPAQVTAEQICNYDLKCDKYLEVLFGVESSRYYRHAARQILLTAIYRAFMPGFKVDEVTVLQGPQNAGKDAVIKSLLPDQKYFTDALAFNASDKEKIEITRGKVFVCASELGGVTTTKDLEALKRWITTTSDRVRLAYRRDGEDLPRRFVVVGTTNSYKPLPQDATGNRRWLVVPLAHGAHVEPAMDKMRADIWRDAIALYYASEPPNLPFEMKQEQAIRNNNLRRSDDQIEDIFDEFPEFKEPLQLWEVARLAKLCESKRDWVRAPKQDQHRLRDVMLTRGWTQQRGSYMGMSRQWWLPPGVKL